MVRREIRSPRHHETTPDLLVLRLGITRGAVDRYSVAAREAARGQR